jgi:thioredoxin 1
MEKRLVKYEATWCGPCEALDSVIESAALDITIEKVDIDENIQRSQDDGVRAIPTLILMDGGKEIARHKGLIGVDKLKEFVNG